MKIKNFFPRTRQANFACLSSRERQVEDLKRSSFFSSFILNLLVLLLTHCSGPPMPDKNPEPDELNPMRTYKEIILDLKNPNAVLRRQAILDCMEEVLPECLPELRLLISKDSDPGVRSVSAVALGEYKDKSSLNKILSLKNDTAVYPETILDALTRLGDKRAAPEIIEYLNSANHTIRLLAVEGFRVLQAKNLAAKILNMALKNEDSDKHKTYAMALGVLEYKPSEDYLIHLVETEENGPTKAAAILALGKIKSTKSSSTLLEYLKSDYPKGRENAYFSLKNILDPKIMNSLLSIWENNDRELRYLSASIVASYPPKPYLTRVRNILKEKKTATTGPAALVLGEWKDIHSRKIIENYLLDLKMSDREELAKALGWIGSKDSEPTLWKVLDESDGKARYGAAWALGFAGSEQSVPYLIKASESKDKRLASLAIESLGSLKSPSSLDALLKASEDDNLAPFAITALAQIPNSDTRLALEKMASSGETIQSKLAIEALGQRKDKESIPVLKELSRSKIPEIRKMAKFALKTIEKSSSH